MFADGPIAVEDARLRVDLSLPWNTALPSTAIKTDAIGATVERTGDGVAWIDADELVFCDFPSLLPEGATVLLGHGAAEGLQDLGQGFSCEGANYVRSGVMALQPDAVRALLLAMRDWPDNGETWSVLRDQTAINRLRPTLPHVRLEEIHPEWLFGGDMWGGEHPFPANKVFAEGLQIEAGRCTWRGRPVAVVPFIAPALAAHIADGFGAFNEQTKNALCYLYSGDDVYRSGPTVTITFHTRVELAFQAALDDFDARLAAAVATVRDEVTAFASARLEAEMAGRFSVLATGEQIAVRRDR